MSGCVSISDYYLQDVPKGTLYMPDFLTSEPRRPDLKGQHVNRTKLHMHYKPGDWRYAGISGNYNFLSFLGKGLLAVVYEVPDDIILQHWGRAFGTELIPEFASWNEKGQRIIDFPLEDIPAADHVVDPDAHYRVLSKKFIGEIQVPQAKILDRFQSPCVVKATHGMGGSAVYIVNTKEEYDQAVEKLGDMPNCKFIITELIPDVVMTYSAHFYVTKSGDVQWIGVCEQYLEGSKFKDVTDNVMRMDEQSIRKSQLFHLCKTVGEAVHKEGYFGYCGIDVVINKNNKPYVVDINARLNGSTTLVLSSILNYKRKGYNFSTYRRAFDIKGLTLKELIEKVEVIEDGMAVLVFALPCENGLRCGFRVYSNSEELCEDIYRKIDLL